MINFHKYHLENGLRIIIHPDVSTPFVSICVTYAVGTRDENPQRTGFAHLFEHLMFGGSKHAPDFDQHIQNAGGENNAFTNQDITVYYDQLPLDNWEIGLWLESDRMQNLLLNQKALDVQRKVVVEEFKETCLNQPYGDIWHHIGPLLYKQHPYQVPTIGAKIEHIQEAELSDVQHFFDRFYCPNNAVVSICGNLDPDEAVLQVRKWFEDLPAGNPPKKDFPQEKEQTTERFLEVEAEVSLNALFMIFHSAHRLDPNYYLDDMLTNILAEGEASLLFKKLVKQTQLFGEIDAYITGTIDQGLLVIEGKLSEETTYEEAEAAVWEQLQSLQENCISADQFQKLQNHVEHNLEFGETNSLHKAINLGYYEILGDANWVNEEKNNYLNITPEAIRQRAQNLFQRTKCSRIHYKMKEENSNSTKN
ncbi:MAG: insulinase family protein [Saprospiraceae bacterium]|nr:insulinase family protein [Saprospiraceae bacterium]